MSELMDKIKGVTCSDVFEFSSVAFPASWSEEMVLVAGRAIRNYDDMKEQIAQLQAEKAELMAKLSYFASDEFEFNDGYEYLRDEIEQLLNKLQ